MYSCKTSTEQSNRYGNLGGQWCTRVNNESTLVVFCRRKKQGGLCIYLFIGWLCYYLQFKKLVIRIGTHTHTRTHARTRARTHARTHTRTHAHTHTRTHTRARARAQVRRRRARRRRERTFLFFKRFKIEEADYLYL